MAMLAELQAALDAGGLTPTALRCESWPVPERPDSMDMLARISIETEIGAMRRSLVSWFQWQHPRWSACAPPAVLEHVDRVIQAGAYDA